MGLRLNAATQPDHVDNKTLAVVITQSGETADTLAALHRGQEGWCLEHRHLQRRRRAWRGAPTDGTVYACRSGNWRPRRQRRLPSQLVALYLSRLALARRGCSVDRGVEVARGRAVNLRLPLLLEQMLKLAPEVEEVAARFHARTDFLYLAAASLPGALEGALKLKGNLLIHAEGYPAGG